MNSVHYDWETWKAVRLKDLTAEWGWLTLSGLFWLEPGLSTLGPSEDDSIIIPGTAPRGATIEWVQARGSTESDHHKAEHHTFIFQAKAGSNYMVNGSMAELASAPLQLQSDREGPPSDIRHGDHSLTIVWRSGTYAARLRNRNAPSRLAFAGLAYYPFNPNLVVQARWEAFLSPLNALARTSIGRTEDELYHGKASFSLDGQEYTLLGQETPSGEIFFTFYDRTSKTLSYAGGRFLLCDAPNHGTITLDFNRSYNPPCSFTPWATCSRPHRDNMVDYPINAGEMKPRQ